MMDLLTCSEVAALLKISPGTVRVWTSRGRLPVTKVGRCARYSREEIDRWLQKQNRRKAVPA